jgi:hypothetical protein
MRDKCDLPIFLNSVSGEIYSKNVRKYMPWFDKMCKSEYNAQDDAKATNHDIGDSQKGILATHDSSC